MAAVQGNRNVTVSQLHSNFAEIQHELKRALDEIKAGRVLQSFDILSKVTDAIVVSCEALGLASELPVVETLHRDNFWRALNECWLFALQNVAAARSAEDRLRKEHIVHLQTSVVHWADALAKFGLVDYEMGFWEADIMDALHNILESLDASAD
ncbi:hypothetical protein IWW55_001997 [Coemansia sp. RSA 2706]|nr:hypothetical protein LPJ63_001212 [Coemansia sp. RSA 2711]KAJ1848265.1 hypothetical protein LPJ70_001120 [Coemansia sp. RSA 2708]KAJ2305305.1 hypothetical protein IWW55_001997 [Coemansia sp. RSA 2706]KAJ2312304.1 hypothetical protein IWW54_002166 [Coemansia sp. RSA 2705]KAJ2319663.1 hypothetical protein IWW52_001835 [Coemansia sp. RSA 2704]KAJ2325128.1 hypothetical protein IWW51_002935 [Coemansia sp. RSA 2702]KAJ2368640.1 hypothetical protein H4S01_001473 [Coemansia sp. RSA 2610]KAJ239203